VYAGGGKAVSTFICTVCGASFDAPLFVASDAALRHAAEHRSLNPEKAAESDRVGRKFGLTPLGEPLATERGLPLLLEVEG
jgi:hypothetical protein